MCCNMIDALKNCLFFPVGHRGYRAKWPLPVGLGMRYSARMGMRLIALKAFVPALGLILLVACSTPASRIKKNPELFNQLPAEVQAKVAAGQIDLGFSREAVRLALGDPSREYVRRTQGGKQTSVWSYTSTYTTTDRQRVDARVRARDSNGQMRTYSDWVYVDVDQRTEFERLRVEFEQDAVTAIETLER